jgi:branched-chain amino acid transport system permease protein
VPSVRSSLLAGAALIGGVALLMAFVSGETEHYVAQGLVVGTMALSLVALTGLSGQVSLTQYLFVGLGAFVTGKTFGGGSVWGMLAGGLISAAVGIIVAVPAVRLRGLHLALSTFGIALVGREAILGDPRVFGLVGLTVDRPNVLGWDTGPEPDFAVWSAVVFVLLAVLLGVVRRSWFGRQLTAVRDSELAGATLGMRVRTTKLIVFGLSAFIAGCSGALFGGLSGAVQGSQFDPVNSLVLLLFAFVGGITTASGALTAGALFAGLGYAQATFDDLSGLIFIGIAAAAISLGRQPNGLVGVINDLFRRDAPATRRRSRVDPAPDRSDDPDITRELVVAP